MGPIPIPLPESSIRVFEVLYPYAPLIWIAGVVCLLLTRYTHQMAGRSGKAYYVFSAIVRPIGVVLITLGWTVLFRLDQHVKTSGYVFGKAGIPLTIKVLLWIGIGVFALLGIWSILALGLRRSFLFRKYDDGLVEKGPYKYVRHPQFLSAMGITLLGSLLYGSDVVFVDQVVYSQSLIANWVLFAFALALLSMLEDRELESHFGDEYREYAGRVPRLIPN